MNRPALKRNKHPVPIRLQAWDRQLGEPPKAWNAFTVYRDLGVANRSLRIVTDRIAREEELQAAPGPRMVLAPVMTTVDLDAPGNSSHEQATKRQRKKVSGQVTHWSSHWNWVERAAAWDRHCDEFVQKKALHQAQEAFKRQQATNKAIAIACSVVAPTFLRKVNTPEGKAWLEAIPMDDLLRLCMELAGLIKRFQEAERLAHGIHVSADQDTVGQFIWELKLKQPPAQASEPLEFGDGSDNESDPYNVAPAWDPVR